MMIDAHEFDNDDARKTLVFNGLKLGKVEKSRETDRVAGQRPCDWVSNPVSLAPTLLPGPAVPWMSWQDFLAWVLDLRVHVLPALCRHQVATFAVR